MAGQAVVAVPMMVQLQPEALARQDKVSQAELSTEVKIITWAVAAEPVQ
jgi:hypothetical protein